MLLEAVPLFGAKLHAFPVIKPRGVLGAELDAPGFVRCAFRRRDVGLKFDRICSATGNGINISMGGAQAAVMGLGDFGNNQARLARSDNMIAYFNVFCHDRFPQPLFVSF